MLAIRSPCSFVIVGWPLCRDGSPVTMKVEALLRATTRVWTLTLPYFVLRQFGMRSVRERNSSGSGRATTEWGLTGRSTTEDISEVLGLVPEAGSSLLTLDHHAIREYLSHLYERGVSRATVARKLASLRSLFRHLAQGGLVATNPAAMVATPKLERRLPHALSEHEVESLLDNAFGTGARDLRGRSILQLLYANRGRVAELVRADLGGLEICPATG